MSTPARFQFGLSSLLLITTLVAVIMSVSVMVPGIGICLAIVSAPAVVRTYILVRRGRDASTSASMQEKAVLFVACLGVAVLVAVATGAAFFVTCLVGFMVGSSTSRGMNSVGSGFAVGLTLGACAGLPLLIYLLHKWFTYPAVQSKGQRLQTWLKQPAGDSTGLAKSPPPSAPPAAPPLSPPPPSAPAEAPPEGDP